MRIKTFLLPIVFLACLNSATAQDMDTFYIVSQYRLLDHTSVSNGKSNMHAGHFPMQVYLPHNQQVSLFAKEQGQNQFVSFRPFHPNRKLHCLRIVKQRDSLLTIRIVTKDSIRRKSKHQLTVDTTLTITDMPFYHNVFIVCYGGNSPFYNPSKLYISNRPRDLAYIPQNQEKKRKRYLNLFLQGMQYEYNAVTGQLTLLY